MANVLGRLMGVSLTMIVLAVAGHFVRRGVAALKADYVKGPAPVQHQAERAGQPANELTGRRVLFHIVLLLSCYVLPTLISLLVQVFVLGHRDEGVAWTIGFGVFFGVPILLVFPLLYSAFKPKHVPVLLLELTLAAFICFVATLLVPGPEVVGGSGLGIFMLYWISSLVYSLVRFSMDMPEGEQS